MNDLSGSNPAIINAVSQLRTVKSGKDVCDVQLLDWHLTDRQWCEVHCIGAFGVGMSDRATSALKPDPRG